MSTSLITLRPCYFSIELDSICNRNQLKFIKSNYILYDKQSFFKPTELHFKFKSQNITLFH